MVRRVALALALAFLLQGTGSACGMAGCAAAPGSQTRRCCAPFAELFCPLPCQAAPASLAARSASGSIDGVSPMPARAAGWWAPPAGLAIAAAARLPSGNSPPAPTRERLCSLQI